MRFDARGEWFMVSQDTEGLPPDVHAVVRFDGARSESWSLPQENPEYAVANRKVRSQRIRGNETFTVEVVLSETPIKRTVRTYSGYDPDTDIVAPEDEYGPWRAQQARDALQEHLDQRWQLYTARHGVLFDMVLANVDLTFDSHQGIATFRLAFVKWVGTDVSAIKVQRAVRAKKTAKKSSSSADEHDFETSPVPTSADQASNAWRSAKNVADRDAQDQIDAINRSTFPSTSPR